MEAQRQVSERVDVTVGRSRFVGTAVLTVDAGHQERVEALIARCAVTAVVVSPVSAKDSRGAA